MNLSAPETLSHFINRYAGEVEDISHRPIEETGMDEDFKALSLSLTHFNDPYDTFLYADLITKALALSPTSQLLVDLGAGSSVPTLLALKRSASRLKTMAVDIDPEALRISRENSRKVGLESQYIFHQANIHSLIKAGILDHPGILLVSNPPYIPAPEKIESYHLLPVHGGEDGSKFITALLSRDYAPDTTLALFWGSLTNPLKVIPLIEERFDVLYLKASQVHFGHYTTLPEIKDHLHQLRREDRVVFDTNEAGDVQIVIGTILRPKSHTQLA